jgi:tagaturonate epimerase
MTHANPAPGDKIPPSFERFSIGIGDRFGFEGEAQLRALQAAEKLGVTVVPVWNKSNREHTIIGTGPADVRKEADRAVAACGWQNGFYVDADHIGLSNVDRFIDSSNFFTIDVADFIGKPAPANDITNFVGAMNSLTGKLDFKDLSSPFTMTYGLLETIARKYLLAVQEAGRVYRHIAEQKHDPFVVEVSFDEAADPQTPAELLFMLAAIARERIPIQTIAPKFTGSFFKGIDYVGDVRQFTREFEDDIAVVRFAVDTFGLPRTLKLSVHSGSDKFSLYGAIHNAVMARGAGLHLKTAGTTWLEEVIGLAASDGAGLRLAKEIYGAAYRRIDELSQPYLSVIGIERPRLPDPIAVQQWGAEQYVRALRHDPTDKQFNPHFRQLIHIGYKVAAEMGATFTGLLEECRKAIEENVTRNIFDRHVLPLFIGEGKGHHQKVAASGERAHEARVQ